MKTEIKKLYRVKVLQTLYFTNNAESISKKDLIEEGYAKEDISCVRKGKIYDVLDYGEAPDDFDIGDEELYDQWCEMESEDGEMHRFKLINIHDKNDWLTIFSQSWFDNYIKSGILEIVMDNHEEILKIIKSKRQIWFEYLSKCETYKQYNDTLLAYYDHDEKTVKEFYMNEQEFNLIKKWWIE